MVTDRLRLHLQPRLRGRCPARAPLLDAHLDTLLLAIAEVQRHLLIGYKLEAGARTWHGLRVASIRVLGVQIVRKSHEDVPEQVERWRPEVVVVLDPRNELRTLEEPQVCTLLVHSVEGLLQHGDEQPRLYEDDEKEDADEERQRADRIFRVVLIVRPVKEPDAQSAEHGPIGRPERGLSERLSPPLLTLNPRIRVVQERAKGDGEAGGNGQQDDGKDHHVSGHVLEHDRQDAKELE
eukprot:7172482-Prymnesium_polylepis.3